MTSFDHVSTRHRRAQGHDLHRTQPLGPSSSKKLTFSIPDLRFEQSYLLSLQRFIHRDDAQRCLTSSIKKGGNSTKDKSNDTGKASGAEAELYGVPMVLNWGGIIYMTIRNQILAPFVQGAALAILTVYLRPFLRALGARVRTHVMRSWLSIFPPIEPHIQSSSGWMRNQLREFSVGGVGANIALAK